MKKNMTKQVNTNKNKNKQISKFYLTYNPFFSKICGKSGVLWSKHKKGDFTLQIEQMQYKIKWKSCRSQSRRHDTETKQQGFFYKPCSGQAHFITLTPKDV